MLALMLEKEVGDIKTMIEDYEQSGVIVGYHTLIDWDKTERESVSAMIELKITPQRDRGYSAIARRIYQFEEVTAVYLMSGGFDLMVMVSGDTMRQVAFFVAEKLATIDGVLSAATSFVLKKYKDNGQMMDIEDLDERLVIAP